MAAASRRLITHDEDGVEGRYIVMLKQQEISGDGLSVVSRIQTLMQTVRERSTSNVQLVHEFHALPGFTIENANDQVLESLLDDEDVLLIEQVRSI